MIAAGCDHFETAGVVLVEAGALDAHLHDCADCQSLRARHRQMALALGHVGDRARPQASWQAGVWARVAQEEQLVRRRRAGTWTAAGAAAAMAAAATVSFWPHRPGRREPTVEIVAGKGSMRSTSARLGDQVRVRAGRDAAVWLYRDDRRLVGRCDATAPGPTCALADDGVVLELELSAPGRYQVVVVPRAAPAPTGELDPDVAAVARAGLRWEVREIDVW